MDAIWIGKPFKRRFGPVSFLQAERSDQVTCLRIPGRLTGCASPSLIRDHLANVSRLTVASRVRETGYRLETYSGPCLSVPRARRWIQHHTPLRTLLERSKKPTSHAASPRGRSTITTITTSFALQERRSMLQHLLFQRPHLKQDARMDLVVHPVTLAFHRADTQMNRTVSRRVCRRQRPAIHYEGCALPRQLNGVSSDRQDSRWILDPAPGQQVVQHSIGFSHCCRLCSAVSVSRMR